MTEQIEQPTRRKFAEERLRVLVFEMDGQEYVADVAQVREIVRPESIARLGGAPDYVAGLAKLRGRIVPVVDLRKRLGILAAPPSLYTCVVVAKLEAGLVGFLVDSASELLVVDTRDFEVPSPFVVPVDAVYVQGMAHTGDRLLVMLDLERVLSPAEQRALDGAWRVEGGAAGSPGTGNLPARAPDADGRDAGSAPGGPAAHGLADGEAPHG